MSRWSELARRTQIPAPLWCRAGNTRPGYSCGAGRAAAADSSHSPRPSPPPPECFQTGWRTHSSKRVFSPSLSTEYTYVVERSRTQTTNQSLILYSHSMMSFTWGGPPEPQSFRALQDKFTKGQLSRTSSVNYTQLLSEISHWMSGIQEEKRMCKERDKHGRKQQLHLTRHHWFTCRQQGGRGAVHPGGTGSCKMLILPPRGCWTALWCSGKEEHMTDRLVWRFPSLPLMIQGHMFLHATCSHSSNRTFVSLLF